MTGSADTMVSSQVEVAVDPETAFTAFTEELDLWWVRGPINHFAGGRAVAMRCEPGVGGRLLEVYQDDATFIPFRPWVRGAGGADVARGELGGRPIDAARGWLPAHDQTELQQLEHLTTHRRA